MAGIDVQRTYLITFALGAALAGIAGTLVSISYSIAPDASGWPGRSRRWWWWCWPGMGSIFGAFAAGLLLGVAEALSSLRLRRRLPRGRRARAVPAGAAAAAAGPVRRGRAARDRGGGLWLRSSASSWWSWRARAVDRAPRRHPEPALPDLPLVCLGQSWNILGGFAGQVNLGHAAFFGIGALVTRTLWIAGAARSRWRSPPAGVAALAFAMVIGVPTFRLRGAYFAIGTLGLAEVLRLTTAQRPAAISTLPPELVAPTTWRCATTWRSALAAASRLATWFLLRSRLGLGILAVREDEEAAAGDAASTRCGTSCARWP